MKLRSIKSDDTIVPDIKCMWCKDLAFAIDYLHTHNQAHLKIYPQNIFVKNDRLILGEIGFKTQLKHYKNLSDEIVLYCPKGYSDSSFNAFDLFFDAWYKNRDQFFILAFFNKFLII